MGNAGGLRSRRWLAQWFVALTATLVLASGFAVSGASPASANGEDTILALVNQARAANNLGPLALDSSMSAVSTAWANQMAANGVMSHNPDYSSQIPSGWSRAAENVARGWSTPTAVHNAWMSSDGHRANILGDFTHIGIAFITAGGTTWAVENFAKYGASVPPPAPDVVLDVRDFDVSRLSGSGRFDVGVSVTRELFPEGSVPVGGVPVVYVANGYNFPDALTAGPAAALQGGAVLLVEPASIPASVAAELVRLQPQRIVVAGGPGSVSPAVFAQLQGFVPSPSDVVRAGGVDRYEASRTIVRDAFASGGADMAIISTGGNFPDALSAGPAAASQGGPVILVDGSASSIDAATRQLILDLGIQHLYIAGGTASVSPGIESSLKSLLGSGNVVRFAGADRFAVGVLISQEFFASADYTFVATGYKFPDALTGGPLAAAYGAPLYLSEPNCLPTAIATDILDLDAQAIVLLGGPGSLSPAVEQLHTCH